MQLAQVAHAAGESSSGDLSPGTYAIVLGVAGERELVELAAKLEAAGVGHRVITESQPPYSGQAMAIGVEPGPRSELRRLFSSIPLAGCRGPK
jgi:peptidyl-tRNA hydrolase